MGGQSNVYWKKVFGVELFKADFYLKKWLYETFGVKFPKLRDQQEYWQDRGRVYMDEIIKSGYLDREAFFQDMLVDRLKTLEFKSFFEAGCGFGWNIKRVKEEFPAARVGGLDFSATQLESCRRYIGGLEIGLVNGDNCSMPLADDAYDIGFSLGVFMNIHPSKIREACAEMMRVCGKYIIHLEYDENNTTDELKRKRAFKTNIVSHDYRGIYESMGARCVSFLTYKDFGSAYDAHQRRIQSRLDRWEKFEGAEKYIWIVLEV